MATNNNIIIIIKLFIIITMRKLTTREPARSFSQHYHIIVIIILHCNYYITCNRRDISHDEGGLPEKCCATNTPTSFPGNSKPNRNN